ncbi:MAG: hypothetical protein M1830_006630, partial [Pleopsidium flavum]
MRAAEQQRHGRHGKMREKLDELQETPTAPNQSGTAEPRKNPSIADRIGTSASGLWSDVLGSSSANGFSTGLAASMTDGAKGQSSSSSSGPSESSTSTQNFKISPVPGLGGSYAPAQPESFRSALNLARNSVGKAQHDFDHLMFSQDQSLLAVYDREEISSDQRGPHSKYDELPESTSYSLLRHGQLGSIEAESTPTSLHAEDGAAVAALLSDPNFLIDDSTLYSSSDDYKTTPADLFTPRLGPDAIAALSAIKAQLPPPPVHRVPSPTNPLKLLPSFTEFATAANAHPQAQATTTPHAEESYMYLDPDKLTLSSEGRTSVRELSAHPGPSSQQWLDILTRYQDEVWGDMLPLVQEARSEVEQAIAGKGVDFQG